MCYQRRMKSLRLLSLLDHLRAASAPVSAETLAGLMEVSPRTIYRDMVTLQALGAPVRGEAGLGYQLEAGYFLPPLHFDPDEMDAIMLGIRLVGARGGAALSQAATRASGKLVASMGKDAGERFGKLPIRAVSRKSAGRIIENNLFSLMRECIRDRHMLLLDYVDLQGKRSVRTIRPLGLTMFDDTTLLTAWCNEKDDFRNFRLDGIRMAEKTGEVFHHEPEMRFETYLKTLQPEN